MPIEDKNPPRPYDHSRSGEISRLHREVYGYLKTCIAEHHGTDRKGREYALSGLAEIMASNMGVQPGARTEAEINAARDMRERCASFVDKRVEGWSRKVDEAITGTAMNLAHAAECQMIAVMLREIPLTVKP